MKNKKTAAGPFSVLFWNSCKKTCFIPIITFAFLFFDTINNYINLNHDKILNGARFIKSGYFGFFWIGLGEADILVSLLVILGAVLAGTILFRFAQSKKQCNVIFSLGMSRRKIFLAKYLGGLLPFCFAVIIAAFFELVSVFCTGYAPTVPLMKVVIYWIVSLIGIYALTFTIVSSVTAFTGNIIEGTIFTAIIALFPLAAGTLFGTMRGLYTIGGISIYEGSWNFFNPYLYLLKFIHNIPYELTDENIFYPAYVTAYQRYFMLDKSGSTLYDLTLFDYSGAIMNFIYAAVIFTVAYLAFSKRKNEISGSFGRAKGLNEICAVFTGLYAVTLGMFFAGRDLFGHNNGSILSYLLSLALFIVPYFGFKMIFGHKRKKAAKSMLKKIPAYAAVIAIVTIVFSTGLLGYASRIPDADEVESIEFSPAVTNPYRYDFGNGILVNNAPYGYLTMKSKDNAYTDLRRYEIIMEGSGTQKTFSSPFIVEDEAQINRLLEIHRSFVQKGHIRNTASDSCGISFQIIYTLKNGKTIKRYYTETTEENAKRILGLSDIEVVKSGIESFFEYTEDDWSGIGEYLNKIPAELNPYKQLYLYSKYLKESHRCGLIDEDLKKAIVADLENQTASDIFFHKPEDELGVISFGMSLNVNDIIDLPEDYYLDDDGTIIDTATDKPVDYSKYLISQAESLQKTSDMTIISMGQYPRSLVITKSMTNTVKYLTDKGYIKYLDSKITASDVKSIKLATKAESVGAKNADMLPLFTGAYSSVDHVKKCEKDVEIYHYKDDPHDFKRFVNNEITSKSTIQKVLDNSFLYGYCGNDYRVVEVTFNDGSIATYCITGEVYEKLMK